jgi:hypothetical protein
MAGRPRPSSRLGIHAILEVIPAVPRDCPVGFGDRSGALLEDVEQHEELVRTTVEHPEEQVAVVAPKLS